jgi:hypothetical protein
MESALIAISIVLSTSLATAIVSVALLPELVVNTIFKTAYCLQWYGLGEKLLRILLKLLEATCRSRTASALCLDDIAVLCSCGEHYDQAEACHKRALLAYRQLLSQQPVPILLVQRFVYCAEDYASLLELTGRPGEAIGMLLEAVAVLRERELPHQVEVLNRRISDLHRAKQELN